MLGNKEFSINDILASEKADMRNPLNSIVAQELLQGKMIEKLNELFKNTLEQGLLGVPPEIRLKVLQE